MEPAYTRPTPILVELSSIADFIEEVEDPLIITNNVQLNCPIGALMGLQVKAIDDDGASISSKWTVHGCQINPSTVIQDINLGCGDYFGTDPVIYDAKDKIVVAWAEAGIFDIDVEVMYKEMLIKISCKMEVIAPSVEPREGVRIVSAPIVEVPEGVPAGESQLVLRGAGTGLESAGVSREIMTNMRKFGGKIGFIQTVRSVVARRTIFGTAQDLGGKTFFLDLNDDDENNPDIWYCFEEYEVDSESPISPEDVDEAVEKCIYFTDSPVQPLLDFFSRYDLREDFLCWVAYQASEVPGMAKSFIVVRRCLPWFWKAVVELSSEKKFIVTTGKAGFRMMMADANSTDWWLPQWKGNASDHEEWSKPYKLNQPKC